MTKQTLSCIIYGYSREAIANRRQQVTVIVLDFPAEVSNDKSKVTHPRAIEGFIVLRKIIVDTLGWSKKTLPSFFISVIATLHRKSVMEVKICPAQRF